MSSRFSWWIVCPCLILSLGCIVSQCLRPSKNKLLKGRNTQVKHCSLNDTATVLEALETDFYPLIDKFNVNLTASCLLARQRNMYWQFNANMMQTTEYQGWQCQVCGKHFYTKLFTWKHMLRKHPETVHKETSSICFAQFCDVFRCKLRSVYPFVPLATDCHEKEVLTARRKCEVIIRDCLPSSAHHAYDELWRSLCSTLTCEKYLEPFQDSISVWVIIALSICAPIALFVMTCLVCHFWDQFYDPMDSIAAAVSADDRDLSLDEQHQIYLARTRGLDLRRRTKYN